MNNWHVLLVEDDPDSQEVINRILRHYGNTVDTVEGAEHALALVGKDTYDLAILDLGLPGLDGWQLLQAIRQEPLGAELPCVAVTAYHSVEVANGALDAGFAAYFPKPIDSASFMSALQSIVLDR